MKHKRFEENILVDDAYTNYGQVDKNADQKKSQGIAKNFAESLEYEEKKKWFHLMPEEPTTSNKLTQQQLEELKKEASSALHGDTLAYETRSNKSGSSDQQWARTLLNKGAVGDRVAAAAVLIQDNPVHNLSALRNLVGNVKPAKKKDGIVVIDALSELLVSDLLISNVKLRTFEQHPLGALGEITSGNKQARKNVLKLWYYEDQLKELYATYVEALNKFAHDAVEANREKAVSAMAFLLMHHPEREKVLLTSIVNKLGDPSPAVACKATYHLCQLLYNHPNMKEVVLKEIEKMLFRSNVSSRAQYYGICFLNQFYLGKDDSAVADNLIRIYFSFFKANIKKGEIDSRLMSAVLTGVKRARPFAGVGGSAGAEHVAAIHKLVHLATPNVAINALTLLFHVCEGNEAGADRYYTALYRKLTSADLFSTSHSALLFSLIYKSLKRDSNIERVTAFVKRLLQLCCYVTPAQACGMLFLISQVLKDGDKKSAIRLVWTKREVKEEVKEEAIENKDEGDKEINGDAQENLISSVIDEKSEEVKQERKKIDLLKGDKRDLLDDDEEEKYVDMKLDEHGNVRPKRRRQGATPASWYHASVKTEPGELQDNDKTDKETLTQIQLKKTINMDREVTEYFGLARNPAFAGAGRSAYVELWPLCRHYHPTVKMFAEKLTHDQIIQYSGDPLKDFSGIRFLDRFVFKNPKKRVEHPAEPGEVKKVKGSHPKFAVRKNYSAKGIRSLPVTSSSYLNEDAARIPADEKFLYDYLQMRRGANDDLDSDADSVTSEDFNRYLDDVTGTPADEADEELDFMADVQAGAGRGQNEKEQFASDEDDEDLSGDDDDDDSSAELDISGDEDEPVLSADEEELALEGSDDEDDLIDAPTKKQVKNKMKLKLKGKDDLSSLFASAEEFSTLLEETATNKKQGSSQAVSTADNASVKQLAWEDKRDRWIKGYNRKILGKKDKKKFNKNKNAGKSNNKMADKAKEEKRKGDRISGGGGANKKKRRI